MLNRVAIGGIDPAAPLLRYAASVADMVAMSLLAIGQVVRTSGYYASGDGGGNDYEIVAAATGTADGVSYIDLDNGLQAKALFPTGSSVTYTSRAVAAAASVPSQVDYISVLSGTIPAANLLVLHYQRAASDGALITNGGTVHWVPLGEIYPEHWAENTTPGTTDMSAAIQAAEDYRATITGGVLTFPNNTYRCNSQLRVKTGGGKWTSTYQVFLHFYTAAGTDCILIGKDDATTPATAHMRGFSFTNITAWRVNAGSTSAVWRFQKIAGIQLEHCYGWGGFTDYLFEGCYNTFAKNCGFAPVNFAGGTGSAGVKVTALDMTDASKLTGFTFDWRGLVVGGLGIDYGFWLESNDYTVISTYIGTVSQARIYIHPTHADHKIYNVEVIPTSYTDNGLVEATTGVIIDGVGSSADIDLVRFTAPILSNCDRSLWIKAGSPVKRVSLLGVDFHNTLREAVYAEACTNLRLSIIGGSMLAWNYSGTAVGAEQHAIRALGGESLQITGVNFDANGTAMPAIWAVGFADVIITDNVGTDLTATPVSQASNTRYVIKNNIGNTTWPEADTASTVTFTPTISFAGAAVGLTYASQICRARLLPNSFGKFSHYIVLSALGSSTGALRINIPWTANAALPVTCEVYLDAVTPPANTIGYQAVISGNDYATVYALLSTGSKTQITNAHLTNNSIIIMSNCEYFRA